MRGFGMDFATPQTLAKIQDEQAERERARRVKEANFAAYDAARREERSRSGGSVSAMSDVGPGGPSFSNTTIGPDGFVQRDAFDTQSRVGAEFADLARRSAMAQRHNARLGTDSLSAAMRAAMANGGRLPQNLVGLLSRNLGMDGSSQSVYSAGFLNNGDFDIDIVTRGANGGLQRTTRKITPMEQLGIVNSTPGVWGSDGIAVSKRLRNGLRNTYGDSELPGIDAYQNNLAAYNTQLTQKDKLAAMKMLLDYEQKNNRQMDPVTFLRSIPPKLVEQLFPTQYKNPDNPDEGIIAPSKEEVLKTITDFQNGLRQNAAANGGGGSPTVNAILQILTSGDEKPQVPEDVAAFQQGQRERQMREVEEAQARADITRNPQQVIYYTLGGKTYSGNGYLGEDGTVYDGQGRVIEGARPASRETFTWAGAGKDGGGLTLPQASFLVGIGAGRAGQTQQKQDAQAVQDGGAQKSAQANREPKTPEERNRIAMEIDMRKSNFTPEERDEFLAWLQMMPKRFQSSIDYDMAAYWKSLPENERRGDVTLGEDDHLPDKWKKPNHPTFSTESIYHKEGDEAGTWDENGKYVPSTARLEREAKERERKKIEKLRDAGGGFYKKNGRKFVNIIGFESLPEDDIYRRDLDENGTYSIDEDGHSIDEAIKIQKKVNKILWDKASEKDKMLKGLLDEQDRLRREALSMWPNDFDKREAWVKEKTEELRYERDPDYRKRIDNKKKKQERDREVLESLNNMMQVLP